MCNRLYKYLTDNNILHKKQFGFQEGHSTEHAIFQLEDQVRNSFESNQYCCLFFFEQLLLATFTLIDNVC